MVFFVVAPSSLYSPSDPHALKGLTTHKNIFGFEQGLACLTFLLVPFTRYKVLRFGLAAVAGVLLLLSHSSGSLVATVCGLAVLPLLLLFSRRGVYNVVALMVGGAVSVLVAVLLFQNASLIPALFSKDSTLTGRTQLWSLVVVAIGHKPALGFGYDSFWQGLQGSSADIIRDVGWLVPTAHNGYLDLLLSVGLAGAFLMLLPLGLAAFQGYQSLQMSRGSTRFLSSGLSGVLAGVQPERECLADAEWLAVSVFLRALATAMCKAQKTRRTQAVTALRARPPVWTLQTAGNG